MTARGITFVGVYAATTTPLRDGGQVDFDECAKHCARLDRTMLPALRWDADLRTAVRAAARATAEAGA